MTLNGQRPPHTAFNGDHYQPSNNSNATSIPSPDSAWTLQIGAGMIHHDRHHMIREKANGLSSPRVISL
jgi:hypothetical protein